MDLADEGLRCVSKLSETTWRFLSRQSAGMLCVCGVSVAGRKSKTSRKLGASTGKSLQGCTQGSLRSRDSQEHTQGGPGKGERCHRGPECRKAICPFSVSCARNTVSSRDCERNENWKAREGTGPEGSHVELVLRGPLDCAVELRG